MSQNIHIVTQAFAMDAPGDFVTSLSVHVDRISTQDLIRDLTAIWAAKQN